MQKSQTDRQKSQTDRQKSQTDRQKSDSLGINWDQLAFVSHELKTPLSTLQLNVAMLKRQATSREQKRMLHIMEEEIKWMTQFISDTLDLNQTDNKAFFKPQRLKWARWIQDLKNTMEKSRQPTDNSRQPTDNSRQPTGKSRQPTGKINCLKITGTDQELEVLIDPLYMKQALLNLIKNAVEHSPENSPVQLSWGQTKNNQLEVRITDQGEGIKTEDLNKIFEPFYRGTTSQNKPPIKGSGLGLSIAKSIIQAHGGNIYAEPPKGGGKTNHISKGQGAVFVFTLPLVRTTKYPWPFG